MLLGTVVPNNYFAPWDFVKSITAVSYPLISHQGAVLPHNRNKVFQYAKELDDDLLFIDSDMVFTPQDVEKIKTHLKTLDAVTGLCVMGFPPFKPAILKRVEGDYEFIEPEMGLHKIDACGSAFLGISKKVVRAMPQDPFNILTEGKVQYGEDVSFCHRLREHKFQLWCDTSVSVGHIRTSPKYYTC